MSEHAAQLSTAVPNGSVSFLNQHHFLLRRLHSLSGIVPVGVFTIVHLFTNAQMLRGGGHFQHEVNFIHATPALLFIEMSLWASIGFHAVLGVMYMVGWAPNNIRYSYSDNWRYTLQRVTAWIALIFIFMHIATLRWRWSFGFFPPFYAEGLNGEPLAMATTAKALQVAWFVPVLYFVGVLGIIYHWANGLWTAAISWGLTISVQAQRRWGFFCAGLGVALTVFMVAALIGAVNYKITPAEEAAIEARIQAGPSASTTVNSRLAQAN